MIGTGGAASAIAVSLLQNNIVHLNIFNRSRTKAQCLVTRLQLLFPLIKLSCESDAMEYDILINATSVGLNKDASLPIDCKILRPNMVVAKVIMQPNMTVLLEKTQKIGCHIYYGKRMLDEQLNEMMNFFIRNTD